MGKTEKDKMKRKMRVSRKQRMTVKEKKTLLTMLNNTSER